MYAEVSSLDLGKIGDTMDRVAHPREQREASGAFDGIGVVDGDRVEERVDRRAEGGERGHCGFEILVADGIRRGRAGGIERGDEVGFGGFGGVRKSFSPCGRRRERRRRGRMRGSR